MVNKHKQKKRGISRPTENPTRNSMLEKKIKIYVMKKKRRSIELQHFQEMQISDNKDKKSFSSVEERVESEEISSSSYK